MLLLRLQAPPRHSDVSNRLLFRRRLQPTKARYQVNAKKQLRDFTEIDASSLQTNEAHSRLRAANVANH
jgi:hypothetical protein